MVLEGGGVLVLGLGKALGWWWSWSCGRVWEAGYVLVDVWGVDGEIGVADCGGEEQADELGVCEGGEVCAFLLYVSAHSVVS